MKKYMMAAVAMAMFAACAAPQHQATFPKKVYPVILTHGNVQAYNPDTPKDTVVVSEDYANSFGMVIVKKAR